MASEKDRNDIGDELPGTKDTEFQVGCVYGKYCQIFANAKVYTVVYSITICMVTASSSYFSAILTTIEKRFEVSSQRTGKFFFFISLFYYNVI